jgi:dTDP-4-amino-4,6-dideoxygalactose transaminase
MSGMEKDFVQEAFESNYIAPLGPMVDAFEREFCERVGIPHGVAVSSGTAACHLALRLVGVGPGDLVIASTLTFIGSVTPILFQGATPVFIDADRTSWTMDPDLLEEALQTLIQNDLHPKAVLPTDLYGQCADYDRIFAISERYGVPVVLDSAEALGATYKGRHAGSGAKAAFFSFNGNKILTTSGGGILVSEDRDLIEKARFLSQQARDEASHYEHSEYGYNYRMSNLLAAVGRGQLKVLEERVKRKREICAYYQNALADLPGIAFMPEAEYGRCTRWLTVILITPEVFGADREAVRLALEEINIESRPVWKPMHMQPLFKVLRSMANGERYTGKTQGPARVVGGEVAEDLFTRGLCLPSGTQMREEDLERVVRKIRMMCLGSRRRVVEDIGDDEK